MAELIGTILQQFDPVRLKDMGDCKLLNRIDTKYICNVSKLPSILNQAMDDFKIQASKSERIFGYESLYFDTPDMKTYFDHHRGKRIRYKIRFRKYLDTGDMFLEVKKKRNFVRTDKKRTQFKLSSSLDEPHQEFLKNHIQIPESGFTQSIWTLFDRITFVGKNHLERVTIDTNIRFKNKLHEAALPGLVIIEVKRNKSCGISPFIQILHNMLIRPYGVSKYILGNILLNPVLKQNRFRCKVLTVNKICYGAKFNY